MPKTPSHSPANHFILSLKHHIYTLSFLLSATLLYQCSNPEIKEVPISRHKIPKRGALDHLNIHDALPIDTKHPKNNQPDYYKTGAQEYI